jgi:hypothetical protein
LQHVAKAAPAVCSSKSILVGNISKHVSGNKAATHPAAAVLAGWSVDAAVCGKQLGGDQLLAIRKTYMA